MSMESDTKDFVSATKDQITAALKLCPQDSQWRCLTERGFARTIELYYMGERAAFELDTDTTGTTARAAKWFLTKGIGQTSDILQRLKHCNIR